ncbi:MAG TPA: hypothetical protein VMX17_02950 [Candidatus Glassbacteria bacterium]|nr:hypothetical protein [Candidatus Glassbacteria bacterium]
MQKYYTGVGSRMTPSQVRNLMFAIASLLAEKDYTLRSGGALGADVSFEKGCISVQGKREIYLPWAGFNGRKDYDRIFAPNYINDIILTNITDRFLWKATDLIEATHPNWEGLAPRAKRLHTRNVFQVLGQNLESKSDFLICWTPNGKVLGGTATAIKIAQRFNVRVFNLAIPFEQMELRTFIKTLN